MTASLDELERDVELSRARLESDLSRLRDPNTISTAKDELLTQARDYKDEMMDRARRSASETVHSVLDDLRVRAERNPTAALVIGAGLAWRLWRHPPIASLLIAAGVASLANTRADGRGSRTPTTDAVLSARDVAVDRAARVSSAVQDASRQIGEQAQRLGGQIRDSASETGAQISSAAGHGILQAAGVADQVVARSAQAATLALDYAADAGEEARDRVRENPIYFGAAALAVGAALGLAMSRSTSDASS